MLVIDQVQHKIDDAQKETEFIKQSWVKNQNQNVQLIIKRNKQVNELNTVHESEYLYYKLTDINIIDIHNII